MLPAISSQYGVAVTMNQQYPFAALLNGVPTAKTRPYRSSMRSLERRRLECYCALIVSDVAAILIGFMGTGWLYLGTAGLGSALRMAELILPLYLIIAFYKGAYSLRALEHGNKGSHSALGALVISAAAVVFIAFYTRSSINLSRMLLTSGVLGAAVCLIFLRNQMRFFVVWRCGAAVINAMTIRDGGPPVALPGSREVDIQRLGITPALNDPDALHQIGLLLSGVDRVTVSCPPERRKTWATILRGANIEGEVIDDAVLELAAHGARIASGHGLLRVSAGPLELRERVMKRTFDLAFATLGLILLLPLFVMVAVAIRLEDGGPILFVQRRVGRGNRFFRLLKFRSMRPSELDFDGVRSTQRGDRRLTGVGALIRRTSIDELPQLINVLKGEMSLVGPRPHALGSLAGDKPFWEVDERYLIRHALKPGLTGLAQIRGLRGSTEHENDLAQRLNADLEYLNGWSIWGDFAILFQTIRVLTHAKAY